MIAFFVALAAFIAIHVGLSATGLRRAAVRAMGEGPYRGVFSLASAVLLAALLYTYSEARWSADNIIVWSPPSWTRLLTYFDLAAALFLIVPGLLTPGPTFAGFEGTIKQPEPARGVLRITRHPFLWGVALWGAGHFVSSPDLASMALFGGLAGMALLGTRSIDRKTCARTPQDWERLRAITSNVPFAAIAQGRNRLDVSEFWWKIVLAGIAFAAIAYFHRILFGVAALSFGA